MFRRVTCVLTFGLLFCGFLAFFTSFRVLVHSVRGEVYCLVLLISVFLGLADLAGSLGLLSSASWTTARHGRRSLNGSKHRT